MKSSRLDGGDEFFAAVQPAPPHYLTSDRIMLFMSANSPGDLNAEFQQILAHYHQSEQARLEQAKAKLRTEILPALVQHRVANVEAVYSGYGDSGAIDGVQFRDAAGQRVERTVIPADLHTSLDNCLYEFLPAGFEINDGSQGTLTLDVLTGKVTIQHQENYTESRDSTQEYTL